MNGLLQDVVSASVDGVCVFDPQHVCILWSPAMERLTGVPAASAVGKQRAELLPDGDARPYTLLFTPAHDGGVIGIARKTEEGITELLSLASHKLKTPLTALQIHLGAQARQLQRRPPDLEALERGVGQAIEQSMRLADTINLLVDVSRIDSGRWKLDVQDFELGELVEGIVSRLKHTAAANGCEVKCKLQRVLGRWDRARLEEVVSTLLANAFKHGAGKPVEVTLRELDTEVELAIADHGPGIEEAELSQVFERAPRTALGLWIAKELVTAHHGQLLVQSGPDIGTTFIMKLPK